MKKIYKIRYLLLGLLLGIMAQLIGRIEVTPLGNTRFNISGLLGDLDVWPCIIVIILYRKKSPKEMLRDLIQLFVGLCISYYGYTSLLSYINLSKMGDLEYLRDHILKDLQDGLTYMIIGALSGIWGYYTVKLRDNNKMTLYKLMLVPFYIVQIFLIMSSISALNYRTGMLIIDIICLIIMIYLYINNCKRKK